MVLRPGHPSKPDADSVDNVIMVTARGWLDGIASSRRAFRVAPAGPLRRAVLAARLSDAFDVLAAEAVAEARASEDCPSWTEVGHAFGIRAQSAHQRFGRASSERDA
ncbi:MAG: hypothetical protein IPG46_06455 [Actinobacteria bacterium]|nr:hypothetical protein [Actinomycetota bacterium]